MASGFKKANAIRECIEGNISNQYTCTAVQNHPKAIVVCDKKATFELKVKTYEYYLNLQKNIDILGKSIQDNIGIIKHLKQFKQWGHTVLIGLSRKSFLHKILDSTADAVLPAALAMGAMSLFNGADILRVHDIEEHVQIKKVIEYFYRVE